MPTSQPISRRRSPNRAWLPASRLRTALEQGRIADGEKYLGDFALDLRRLVQAERQPPYGRLVPVSAESQLEKFKEVLYRHAWRGPDLSELRSMIPDNTKIAGITFWAITLEGGRTITRDQVRQNSKPISWSNKQGSWESQFVSDATIRELETAATRVPTPVGSDSRNLDYPNGVRP